MPLHILKEAPLARLVSDVERRSIAMAERNRESGLGFVAIVGIGSRPRRAAEILDGGSLFWFLDGRIRCRQRIVAIERRRVDGGPPTCEAHLDPVVVPTEPMRHRVFRDRALLEGHRAPRDLDLVEGPEGVGRAEMPAEMRRRLARLGVL